MKPAYRVEVEIADRTRALTPFPWHSADYGRPSADNLAGFVRAYNRSFMPGGSNEHVGLSSRIIYAELIRQSDGHTLFTWSEQ